MSNKIVAFVKRTFNKHPIIANSVVYGVLFVGAEVSQQTITRKILVKETKSYDTATVGRYALYSTFVQGPILTIWYRWLDRRFVGQSLQIITKKVLLDQFLMTPQIYVLFYVAMSFLENRANLFEECQKKFIPTFKTSCLFWLPVQTINFLLIPATFRVAYVGTCSFAWVNILCWFKRQEY